MASWSTRITLPNGTVTFRASDSAIPQAAKDSAFWTRCTDGNWYYNRGPFASESICEQLRETGPPVKDLPAGFAKTYGDEPGPNSLKNVWRGALETFVSDSLPEGFTAEQAQTITEQIAPFGLPPARFFVNNNGSRCLMRHDATENGTLRYIDFVAAALTDPTRVNDTIAAWQCFVALSDPGSFPKWAIITDLLSAHTQALLEAAQRA